jgi:peptide chain release factor 3
MQFEVFAHRLEHEFGAAIDLSPTSYTIARRTDDSTVAQLAGTSGVTVLKRRDGTKLALFESMFWLQRVEKQHPEGCFEVILTGTTG